MDYKKRFYVIAVLLGLYVCFIWFKSFQTVIIDGPKYRAKVEKLKVDSIPIPQLRGFIFADGNELLAGSLPEYDVFLDFRSTTVPDSRGKINIPADTIAYYFSDNGPGAKALHEINPSRSTAEYARIVRDAYAQRARRLQVLHAVPYLEYKRLRASMPYFSKPRYSNGILSEERAHRYRPYGETRMGAATIGSVYAKKDSTGVSGRGKGGIEEAMDSILRGKQGLGFRQIIRRNQTDITVTQPVNGANVHTTINVEMQDILDQALCKRILELRAHAGWAAIIECKTGKIKAISNLERISETACAEDHNHLFEDLVDPGSTFKTVSYMVLLDDGKITPETRVNTGNYENARGEFIYHGQHIRDDHPVGEVTADEAMVQSSNISLAKLTTQAYESNPQAYLDGIERIGLLNDRALSDSDKAEIKNVGYLRHLEFRKEFPKAQAARHRQTTGRSWSKVSLAQISYGYETQIPGIYMLQFYNAIANDGKMMRPYIVDYIEKDGDILWKQKPTVINPKICKESTLKAVRHALEGVVERGTAAGKPGLPGAKSKKVKIAGKTGTAQRYNAVTRNYVGAGHNVSFAGYFPADDPEYCGIVVIDARPGGNFGRPGGGYMAGPVFKSFAEQIWAIKCNKSVKDITPDTIHAMGPSVKNGPLSMTKHVLSALDLDTVKFKSVEFPNEASNRVPDVRGMGANDALYKLESLGLRVNISGKGAVTSQSMAPGSACKKGDYISLTLK